MSISDRSLARIGAVISAISFISLVTSLWLGRLNPPTQQTAIAGGSIALAIATYALVGGLLVYRQPRNLVGWLLLGLGFCGMTNNLGTEYARYALFTNPGSLPFGSLAAWYAAWSFQPVFYFPIALMLFFPNGRLLSRRWRWLVWVMVASFVISVVPYAFAPQLELGQTDWNIRYPNPVALPVTQHFMNAVVSLGMTFLLPGLLFGVVTVIVRYRRASAIERLQLRWFVFSTVASIGLVVLLGSVPGLSDISFGIALMVFPAAISLAVLRYRLYDIDRIISRSLAYLLVIGLLLVTYLLLVLAMSTLSPLGKDSPAVVALSTLLVAGLFRPVLDRVRKLVDVRFNRERYDAAQTLEAFTRTLSSEVDIEALKTNLSGVVAVTMRPSAVSLWIRNSPSESVE